MARTATRSRRAKDDTITGILPASRRRDGLPCRHHAGRRRPERQRRRVLCVTALGDSVKQAQARAYEMLKPVIHFDGAQYRSDIGHRAIKR